MVTSTVSTSSERIDKDRVRLRVEVPEAALNPALDAAYRRWAREIKIPGFRKGKVPRQIIDTRVGEEVVREEALRDALPDLYRDALLSEELEAIAPPDIEIVEFHKGEPLVFEATVDVRPEVQVPDLATINVDAPDPSVTDADVDEQLEALRDRFAELETVARDVRQGDHVLIDLTGSRHGQPVEGASAPDLLYEVGSRSGPPRLDDELEGSRPGVILKFNDTLPEGAGELGGQEISFTVLVKEVKAKRLPALDDDFAKTVGEFDSLDALRADLRDRLGDVKRRMAEEELRRRTLDSLVDASPLEPPVRLVDDELRHRLEHLEGELRQAGMSMDDYARGSGSTELEIRSRLRSQVERSVKAELLLEEIARRESIDVTSDDLGTEIAMAAARTQRDPKELAQQLAKGGGLNSVAADIMRRKALEYVVEHVNVVGRAPDDA